MKTRRIISVLLVLNLIVLLGQLWPEGAPPFARGVNIVFLAACLLFFADAFRRAGPPIIVHAAELANPELDERRPDEVVDEWRSKLAVPTHVRSVVGEQLSAVSFVMDYVEFHFDGHVIRALSSPIVDDAHGTAVSFPGPGSRDALCAQIGTTVSDVLLDEGVTLKLTLSSGARLVVPLVPSVSGEAMHYKGPGGPMEVW